jgi:hypothetical protein
MSVGRRIAASHMTTNQAHPQMHPLAANLQALLATLRRRLHLPNLIQMATFHGNTFPRPDSISPSDTNPHTNEPSRTLPLFFLVVIPKETAPAACRPCARSTGTPPRPTPHRLLDRQAPAVFSDHALQSFAEAKESAAAVVCPFVCHSAAKRRNLLLRLPVLFACHSAAKRRNLLLRLPVLLFVIPQRSEGICCAFVCPFVCHSPVKRRNLLLRFACPFVCHSAAKRRNLLLRLPIALLSFCSCCLTDPDPVAQKIAGRPPARQFTPPAPR